MAVKHVETEVKIAELKEFEGNPRRHSAEQLAEMKRSLEMFGQYRPFVLADDKTILAGNGMYQAMVELGWKTAKAIVMKGLDENQQRKLVLADNQVALMGSTDYTAVEELLAELEDYEVPGYDPESLRQLMATTEEALEDALDYGVMDDEEIAAVRERSTYDTAGDESIYYERPDYDAPPPAEAASPSGMSSYTEEAPSMHGAATPVENTPDNVATEDGENVAVCSACGRPW